MTRSALTRCFAVALVLVSGTLTVRAQSTLYVHPTVTITDGILRIELDEPRPLFRALRELQRKYGCTASYEDLPLEHAGDIVESVIAETGYRYIGPRGGALMFSHPFGVAGDPAVFEGAVRALVRAHEDQGFPGRFKVEREGVMIHVIPVEMRGKTGDVVAVKPLMDTPLVFPVRDWDRLQRSRSNRGRCASRYRSLDHARAAIAAQCDDAAPRTRRRRQRAGAHCARASADDVLHADLLVRVVRPHSTPLLSSVAVRSVGDSA